MGRKGTPLIALCAATIMLTSCTSSTGGEATPASSSSSAASKLDTGNYPTAPRTVKAVTAADSWQQEGWALAEHTTAPWDVDPRMSKSVPGASPTPLIAASQLGATETGLGIFSAGQITALSTTPFQTGFATAAQGDGGLSLRTGLLRYPDAASAQRAVDAIAGDPDSGAGPLPRGVTTAPGARVVRRAGDSKARTVTLIAPRTVGTVTLLAVTSATAIPTDPARWQVDNDSAALDLAGKALDRQYADAAGYQPSPVVGLGGGGPSVAMDRDGIMSRTLASTGTADGKGAKVGLSPAVGLGDGWMGVRAATVYSPGAQVGMAKIRDTYGFDLLGTTAASQVYRLGDDARATKFLDEYMLPTTAANITPLPGVDGAIGRCGKPSEKKYRCGVVSGRYVAVVSAPTLAQAQQAASASLSILRTAK